METSDSGFWKNYGGLSKFVESVEQQVLGVEKGRLIVARRHDDGTMTVAGETLPEEEHRRRWREEDLVIIVVRRPDEEGDDG